MEKKLDLLVNLDNSEVLAQLSTWLNKVLQESYLMAMENLSIAQLSDSWYACACSGVYCY